MKFIGIIPARYASTRFPGKPLARIGDKPMIRHVYENASRCSILTNLIIATDDERIRKAVESFDAQVMMTSTAHKSGTDRCGEVAKKLLNNSSCAPEDIVINIQGDEPFISEKQIAEVTEPFMGENAEIATLIKASRDENEHVDANVVKVVIDKLGKAMYFSRSPVPFFRMPSSHKGKDDAGFFKHIGIYAFTVKTLLHITGLPMGKLEKAESLEQLRWLENGLSIHTRITETENFSIDTPRDLKKLP